MDDFDDIINNQPDDLPENQGELGNIWEVVDSFWPHFYEGMLIKGVMVVEYVDPDDGGRILRFISSPETTPWEMLGMLESARLDARDLSRSATVVFEEFDNDDDDDNGVK